MPWKLRSMDDTTFHTNSHTVEMTVYQRGRHVWVSYVVYNPYEPGKRQKRVIRKVRLDVGQQFSVGQLTLLMKRMVDYVMPQLGHIKPVPQGLPYQEVGVHLVSVGSPGRGKGEEEPTVETPSVRPIPKPRKPGHNHFAPTPPGVQRVARKSSSDLDLSTGEREVTLDPDLFPED
jgi:hypothetical protein